MAVRQSAINIVVSKGFSNVQTLAKVVDELGMEFSAAVALMELESMGKNIYGSDKGGTFAGRGQVTEANYKQFRHLVVDLHHPSNGVGPAQITWRGFLVDMEHKGLKPWLAHDNMRYGLTLLMNYYKETGSWTRAGQKYNGSLSYGIRFAAVRLKWRVIFLADAKKNS